MERVYGSPLINYREPVGLSCDGQDELVISSVGPFTCRWQSDGRLDFVSSLLLCLCKYNVTDALLLNLVKETTETCLAFSNCKFHVRVMDVPSSPLSSDSSSSAAGLSSAAGVSSVIVVSATGAEDA